jgi:cell fate regulator YaaT (PSP1 superfamily)
MPTVVGVTFKPVTKIYYFDPGALRDLVAGDYVVVETSQGNEVGLVAWEVRDLPDQEIVGDLKPVLRRATPMDLVQRDRYEHRQPDTLSLCRSKARDHGLPMRVVSADFNFDGTRLVVSFTADGRVDFRDLVRDLARTFNARIEMKQIGVRDEAKVLDGVGKCGRRLCCASWLRDFDPVTIKMAKQQNLPLNPSEISGVCGRLLCCLSYEMETYTEARKRFPKAGSTVVTPDGEGRVRKIHALRESVTVRLEDGEQKEFAVTDLVGDYATAGGRSACSGCAARRRAPGGRQPGEGMEAGTEDSPGAQGAKSPSSQGRRSRRRRPKSPNS